MGMDARVRYTKMIIQSTFVELLKRQPVNRITVKRICELADINRATFYKYYRDPFDLLEQIELELLQELKQYISHSADGGLHEKLALMLKQIKSNAELYITLVSENGDSKFSDRIIAACYEYIEADIRRQFPNLTDVRQEWVYFFAAQGSSGVLKCWIEGGMAEPENEVAGFLEGVIKSITLNV